ncbi:hypothetical protein M436DRAFT_81192 [Aureobasidium namibiae CBS 147.97]|uniref:F-box domain-containing protein n=1 Tax=Aureobasidium namibiae CBS 147.97 TaxID=1043004 RepID=A0A074WQA0_9PEZI
MPPKRTKKAPAVPKTQGKLSFQRIQKPQTTVSPLVQILSQYELMLMVTDQLSSADIIHLTATCKEIKMYLTDDKTIYNSIVENANCDGKGIEARAKCFGHWKGDVTKATAQCGGSDCKPYDGCAAMVCNECRFHIAYMNNLACCRNDPAHWQSHEVDFAEDIDSPEFHSGNFPLETIRAAHLAGETRERRFCSECKPHLCEEEGPVLEYIFDIIFDRDDEDWCSCTFGERFLDDSWLCIPCFIKEEAEAYRRPLKKKIFKWETNADGSRKFVGTEKHLCDCGRVADIEYLVECRWCDEYMLTPKVHNTLLDF